MDLPRYEMAFRADYEDALCEQSLTTVFRPGNRIFPSWRGYKLGEIITGRVIERCGCDLNNTPPLFKEAKIPLRIAKIEIIQISKLSQKHFDGSSQDVTDLKSLEQHIYKIYNAPLSDYDNTVTRIALEYLEPSALQLRA